MSIKPSEIAHSCFLAVHGLFGAGFGGEQPSQTIDFSYYKLIPELVVTSKINNQLYFALAAVDAIKIGEGRERQMAITYFYNSANAPLSSWSTSEWAFSGSSLPILSWQAP